MRQNAFMRGVLQSSAVAPRIEPGDELRVVAGEDRGDRAAHAVADRQHRLDLEVREQRGGVVGAGLERERLGGADAAPVAAVVDRQDAVAGLLERAVGRVPVEVGREHPAVQEQDGRAVAAAVAQEHLAAPGDVDDAAAGQRDRRFGGPVRHRRQPSSLPWWVHGRTQHVRGCPVGPGHGAAARSRLGGGAGGGSFEPRGGGGAGRGARRRGRSGAGAAWTGWASRCCWACRTGARCSRSTARGATIWCRCARSRRRSLRTRAGFWRTPRRC